MAATVRQTSSRAKINACLPSSPIIWLSAQRDWLKREVLCCLRNCRKYHNPQWRKVFERFKTTVKVNITREWWVVVIIYYISQTRTVVVVVAAAYHVMSALHTAFWCHIFLVFHQTIWKNPSLVGALKASLLTAVNVMKHVVWLWK